MRAALRSAVGFSATPLLLAVACASDPPAAHPTLAEYSDQTLPIVEELATAYRHGGVGHLPPALASEAEAEVASFASISGLQVRKLVGRAAAALDLGYVLDRRRERFASLTRLSLRIAAIEVSASRARLELHWQDAGALANGARLQLDSRFEATFERSREGWRLLRLRELRRTEVLAPERLLEPLPLPPWTPSSHHPENFRNAAAPGDHDTGGVGIIENCLDGRRCAVIGGGTDVFAVAWDAARRRLVDVTARLGLDHDFGETKGFLTADLDRDGEGELLISAQSSPLRLLQRRGERFVDVTADSGLENLVGAFRGFVGLDADGDGRLDIYLVQYGDGSKTGPTLRARNGERNRLFRNVTAPGGRLRFVDVSASSGADDSGWGLAAGAADYDDDGRMDLYVANDFGRNALYRNVTRAGGPIRFEDVAKRTGSLDIGFGMGVAWADYDQDDDLDLHVTNYWMDERWVVADRRFPLPPYPLSSMFGGYARRRLQNYILGDTLLRNDGATFARRSLEAGVEDGGWAWGTVFTDVDGDGWQDLVVANGMLRGRHGKNRELDFWNRASAEWDDFSDGHWTIDFGEDGITGPQPERLFINLHDGTFAEASWAAGFDTDADLRGLAAADLDGDSVPELIGGGFLEPPVIFRNRNLGPAQRFELRFAFPGQTAQPVGARARLLTNRVERQLQEVSAGNSFLSDSGRTLYGGLGPRSPYPPTFEVRWPGDNWATLAPTSDLIQLVRRPS